MSRLLPVLSTLVLGGCIFVHDDGPDREYAPNISWADGSCYWDGGYRDYVWWFQAEVQDYDGDVVEVTADVYDDWDGAWVDAFDLWYSNDGTWFSAWQGSTTWLDCTYLDYTVEITAVDSYGRTDVYAFETW